MTLFSPRSRRDVRRTIPARRPAAADAWRRTLLTGVAALATSFAAAGAQTPDGNGGPQAEALRERLKRIELPPGFEITLYAIAPGARTLAVGRQGKMLFVGTRDTKVYALPLRATSDLVEEVTEFASGTPRTMPHGVCFAADGTLFVAEQNRILSYERAEDVYAERDPPARTVVAAGALIPRDLESGNHSTRVCRVGPDGALYVSLGQPDNVPSKERRRLFEQAGIGTIVRMDRDGGGREIFASGIRNSVGMDFNPADGSLWFTDNQADRMGDDIPPGELNRASKPGLNFGFPWYGGGHVRTEIFADETPPPTVFPQVETTAHAADLGMTFYHGARLPPAYRGGIFSAQHGSWNRSVPVGARIMFTPVKPDETAGEMRVFASGWLDPVGAYWGRPVDVLVMPDGALLVSDDQAGKLYRVTYRG